MIRMDELGTERLIALLATWMIFKHTEELVSDAVMREKDKCVPG